MNVDFRYPILVNLSLSYLCSQMARKLYVDLDSCMGSCCESIIHYDYDTIFNTEIEEIEFLLGQFHFILRLINTSYFAFYILY